MTIDGEKFYLQDGVLEVRIDRVIYWMGDKPSDEELEPKVSVTILAHLGASKQRVDLKAAHSFSLEAEEVGLVEGKLRFPVEGCRTTESKNLCVYTLGYLSVFEHNIAYDREVSNDGEV
ncbi:hypothetical protein D3C71_1887670 [compost metagenome]